MSRRKNPWATETRQGTREETKDPGRVLVRECKRRYAVPDTNGGSRAGNGLLEKKQPQM